MELRFTREADAQLASRREWWRDNRREPKIFDEELAEASRRLTATPSNFPIFAVRRGRTIHRCLLPRVGTHLYFEIDEGARVVVVVLAWGAVRGRKPPL